MQEGLLNRDTLLVVITNRHWDAVAAKLRAQGQPPWEPAKSGQLTVRDAPRRWSSSWCTGGPTRICSTRWLARSCGNFDRGARNPRQADALRKICTAHSHVRSNPRDVLGSFLVSPFVPAGA